MGYKVDITGNILEIEIDGNFSIYDVLSFKNEVTASFENKTFIGLNLSNIDNIDTAGIQVLISLIKTCKKNRVEFHVKGNEIFFKYLNSLGSNLESFFKNSEGIQKNA